jgi:hypothetical protein
MDSNKDRMEAKIQSDLYSQQKLMTVAERE